VSTGTDLTFWLHRGGWAGTRERRLSRTHRFLSAGLMAHTGIVKKNSGGAFPGVGALRRQSSEIGLSLGPTWKTPENWGCCLKIGVVFAADRKRALSCGGKKVLPKFFFLTLFF